MTARTMAKRVSVRFPLTKGHGPGGLTSADLSADEISDIRKILTLNVSWDPEAEGGDESISEACITAISIIYDGISPIHGREWGIRLSGREDEPFEGYPAPIIQFALDRSVEPEKFLRCVWETSVSFLTASMREVDGEPGFAEDHNGYSSVLEGSELEELTDMLKENGAYCGKNFSFGSDGLPAMGHSIEFTEFATAPSSTK